MSTTTSITSRAGECISSGIILFEAGDNPEILLEDDDEKLRFTFNVIKPPVEVFTKLEPANLKVHDIQGDNLIFELTGSVGALGTHFGPLRIGLYRGKGIYGHFRAKSIGPSYELIYSFWLKGE